MARINEEKIFKIKELIKQNKKVADISKELQVSLNAIYKIKKELEIKPEIKQNNILETSIEESEEKTNSDSSKESSEESEDSKETSKESSEESEITEESINNNRIINIKKDNVLLKFVDNKHINKPINKDTTSESSEISETTESIKSSKFKNKNMRDELKEILKDDEYEYKQKPVNNHIPVISKNLMVSDEYQKKRQLILTLRSYLELFFETKPGIRILIGIQNKNDLPIFNSKLFDYSVDELEKLKSNILFEINVNENSTMIIDFSKQICHGYEKTLCSIGYDIESFTDSLYNDKMFIDNLKLLSCEINFSEYLSPTKAILFAIIKQTFIVHKINQIKKSISHNDKNNINDKISQINNNLK